MKYNNGECWDFTVLKNDRIDAAREMSEESKSLEKLLLTCFDNNIETRACCAHEPYISFVLTDENLELHKRIKQFMKKKYNVDIIEMIDKFSGKICYCVYGNDDSIFDKLTIAILDALKGKNVSVDFYYDLECAYALLSKCNSGCVDLPYRGHEDLFYLQFNVPENVEKFISKYLFSDDYYGTGNRFYVIDQDDMYNLLCELYRDSKLKKGILYKVFGSSRKM